VFFVVTVSRDLRAVPVWSRANAVFNCVFGVAISSRVFRTLFRGPLHGRFVSRRASSEPWGHYYTNTHKGVQPTQQRRVIVYGMSRRQSWPPISSAFRDSLSNGQRCSHSPFAAPFLRHSLGSHGLA